MVQHEDACAFPKGAFLATGGMERYQCTYIIVVDTILVWEAVLHGLTFLPQAAKMVYHTGQHHQTLHDMPKRTKAFQKIMTFVHFFCTGLMRCITESSGVTWGDKYHAIVDWRRSSIGLKRVISAMNIYFIEKMCYTTKATLHKLTQAVIPSSDETKSDFRKRNWVERFVLPCTISITY